MKKIFFLLLIFISLKSLGQYPIVQTIGSDSTIVKARGAIWGTTGIVNGIYTDTTTANLYRISQHPAAQIMTLDETLWIRNSLADAWLQFGNVGGGGSDSAFVRHRNVSIDTLRLYRLSGDSSDVLFDVTAFGSLSDSTLQHATDESIEVGDNPKMNLHGNTLDIDSTDRFDVRTYGSDYAANITAEPHVITLESNIMVGGTDLHVGQITTSAGPEASSQLSAELTRAGDTSFIHTVTATPRYVIFNGVENVPASSQIGRTRVVINNADTLLIDPPYIAAFDGDTLKKIPYVAGGGGGAIITFVSVPSTPTSPGTTGTMAFDANFLYVCISTNTWTRVARATGW